MYLIMILCLLLLGFCTGVISSFFGAGGAFIITPSLNILGFSMSYAVATGLSYTLITSSLSGIKHFLAKNIVIKLGIIIALFSFGGIYVSHSIVMYLESMDLAGPYIRFIYIFLLLFLGIMEFIKKSEEKDGESKEQGSLEIIINRIKQIPPLIQLTENNKCSLWVLIVMGVFIGLLQGILGAGGGFILVPLYMLVLKLPAHRAVGTSLLTIFISSSFGSFSYFLSGNINFLVLLVLGTGTIFGINFGMEAVNNVKEGAFEKLYAIFLISSSFAVILRQFNLEQLAVIYTLFTVSLLTLYIIVKYYYQLSPKKLLKKNLILYIKNNRTLRKYYIKVKARNIFS